ncbi:MAG: hypothetical protein HKN47_11565 [Pirellulaceae bacterium]|nr:hypothetical protein [Pirellulaceae bacterium]
MLPGRIILVATTLVLIDLGSTQLALADGNGDANSQASDWPPPWLEGLWKNESVTVSHNGQASSKRFVCAEYYIFIDGYRFSIYKNRRVRATPMIGQTQVGDVLHCLFKMTNGKAAMRAKFSAQPPRSEYISYVVSSSDRRRYKLTRKLARVPIDKKLIDTLRGTIDQEFSSPHSTSARDIIEAWLRERR